MEQHRDENKIQHNVAMVPRGSQQDTGYEIDLLELFYRLLASWKSIVLMSVIGAAAALAFTVFFITPKYKATSTIYVLARKDSAINISDLQIGTALTQDYVKVFDIWEVHEQVISQLDLPYSYSALKSMLSVTNPSGTRMLDISVTSTDPQMAADIANAYARVSCDFIAETMSTDKPNIVSVALVPTNPVSPSKTKNTMIGFMLGFLLAAGIVTIQMLLDDKIRNAEDIRKYTGLTNLAIIPLEESAQADSDGNNKAGKGKFGA